MQSSMKSLSLLVFTSGAVTLGMELSAARLLEPAFGNNQIVWKLEIRGAVPRFPDVSDDFEIPVRPLAALESPP